MSILKDDVYVAGEKPFYLAKHEFSDDYLSATIENGDLKRMMNERDKKSDALTSEEETELKSRAMVSELERQDDWPKVGDHAFIQRGSKVTVRCIAGDLAWCECPESSMNMITVNLNNLSKPKSTQGILIEELQTKLVENNAVDSWMLAVDILNGKIKGLTYKGDSDE